MPLRSRSDFAKAVWPRCSARRCLGAGADGPRRSIYYAPQHPLYLITAALYALSIPGPLLRHPDLPGQLLFWNAGGWALGLALFGLASVGALPILPLILALVGYTFWPRTQASTLPPGVVAIVLLGGFAVCWLAWGDVEFALPHTWG